MCLNITDREKLQEWSNAFHDQNAARYTSAIISILSTLGSLCIILTYCAMPSMRKVTSRQLLLFLAIADLLSSVSTGVGSLVFFNTYTACRVQAFITVVATLSSVLWSTCMAVYIYLCVSKERMELAKKLRTPFHIICWGIPLLVAIVALLEGALGAPGYWATIGWCWIDLEPKQPSNWKCDDAQMLWMLLSLKGWEVVSYFIIPFMYLQAKRDIKKAISPGSLSAVSSKMYLAIAAIDQKLSVLPMAYVLLRIWGTIRVFMDFTDQDSNIPTGVYRTIFYLQALGDNAQGIVNFILFVMLTDVIRERLQTVVASVRSRRSHSQNINDPYDETSPYIGELRDTASGSISLKDASSRSYVFRGRNHAIDPLKESLLERNGSTGHDSTISHWWSAVDYSTPSALVNVDTSST